MRFHSAFLLLSEALVALGSGSSSAQARQPGAAPRDTTGRAVRDTLRSAVRDSLRPSARDFLSLVEAPPVVTHHSIRLHGATLGYTATTGMLPIRNDTTGVVEGGIFFVAYNRDGVAVQTTRPLTFVFNGGPGSSTVWLHMGAFGPKKVHLNADG